MAEPLHVLKHEHRIIEQALRALDGVCLRLEWGDMVAHEILMQLVDFIGNFGDRLHHRKEEMYLFPALERQGIVRESGPLSMLEHEHAVERGLVADLRRAVDQYKDGDTEARRAFVESARLFTDMLAGHIQKEDGILFRLAEDMLDEDEKSLLAEAFNQIETEIGADKIEYYARLADRLEDEWAV